MIKNDAKMQVAFRVDGGKILGLGHVMRCLSIANSLSMMGIKCLFIVSNESTKQVVSDYGYNVSKINSNNEGATIRKILIKENCKVLIIDSKRKSLFRIINIVRDTVKIVLIDNVQFAKWADLVILPGVREQFKLCPPNSLVGAEYVLLRPDPKRIKRSPKRKLIIFSAGGSDKKNLTYRVVSAFKKIQSNFEMLVIVGKFYAYQDKLCNLVSNDNRFTILRDPHNLFELMSECKFGIMTFGITVYEAAYCKLPIFVISHSDENDESAKRVEKYGWMKYVGKYDEINYLKFAKEVTSYLHNKNLLHKMSLAGSLIDGKGSERVARAIIHLLN